MDFGKYLQTIRKNRNIKIFVIIFFILCCQLTASLFQYSRYVVDVYDCSDMADDCEEFFEGLGFETWRVRGYKHGEPNSHVWLLVEIGAVTIPFETTALAPVSPEVFNHYDDFWLSPGWIRNGEKFEDLEYEDWYS